MKIAVVSAFMFGSSIGGVENHIRFICKELINNGHDVMLFKPIWDGENKISSHGSEMNIQYIECGSQFFGKFKSRLLLFSYVEGFFRKVDYLRVADTVAKVITAWRPDVVWQHDFSSSWLATRKLSKIIPVVLTNHTGEFLLLKRLPFFNILCKNLFLKHYSYVIGPSKELTPEFSSSPVMTIHNGVDLGWFQPLSNDERIYKRKKLLGYKNCSRFVVFCPRRWAPTKGVIFLAQAAKKIVEQGKGKDFLFIFAGDNYDGYQSYAKSVENVLAVSGAQYMRLGNLDVYDMRAWYQIADLVVIPSIMEAVSLAAIEAMACGIPVLSTAVGGMPELIDDGVTGYLVEAQNAEVLALKILSISSDDIHTVVSKNALELVKNNYSWKKIARVTESILNDVKKNPD